MLPTTLARLACGTLGLLILGSAQAVTRSSTFDTDNEGWLVANIAAAPGAGTAAVWDSASQRLVTSDLYTWTTYSAPTAWMGNRVAFYGGTLSFDLMDDLKDDNADTVATFGISAGSTSMYWFGGAPSTTSMTTFTATLSEADTRWRIGGLPTNAALGTLPTAAEFQAVLSGLTLLRINADWRTAGNDTSTLDNVVLQSAPVPEPGAAALLAAGLAVLAWRRRHTRKLR